MSVPKWVFRYRGILVSPPLIFGLVWFKFEIESPYMWILGEGFCLLGLLTRIWAQQHIRRRVASPRHLAISGPYRFTRNPLYVGNTLLCVGAAFTSEILWLAPVTLLWCSGIYSLVVRYEEASLLNKYGDPYRKFISETPRWFPKTIDFKKMEFINEYLRPAVMAEVHCLLILLPYLVKEVMSRNVNF